MSLFPIGVATIHDDVLTRSFARGRCTLNRDDVWATLLLWSLQEGEFPVPCFRVRER